MDDDARAAGPVPVGTAVRAAMPPVPPTIVRTARASRSTP
jgi:hypothetical protein